MGRNNEDFETGKDNTSIKHTNEHGSDDRCPGCWTYEEATRGW